MDKREVVERNLNVAVDENGYTELLEWEPEQVAIDLCTYCPELDQIDPLELTALVADWQSKRRA